MMKLRLTRRALAVSVVVVGAIAIGGTAFAGHITSGVKSYTGCLVGGDGVIVKVAEGNAPKSPCTGGQTQVHLSGGDITKISVTGALSGGGDNGDVTIGLKPEFTLPSGCSSGQVAKWNGSGWACAADNDTTYSADGTTLNLSAGNVFSIASAYRTKNNPDCSSGQFATGFDSSGNIQCAAPASGGAEVWHKMQPAEISGGVIVLPKQEGVDVISMPLPAGTFLVTAVATARDRNSDDEVAVNCNLRNGAFSRLPVHGNSVDIGEGSNEAAGTVAVHGVIVLTSPDTVRLTCTSNFGDDDPDQVDQATITAMKVGTVHTP